MLHLDETRQRAIEELERLMPTAPRGSKAVLIDDLFGRLRLVLWVGKKDQVEPLRQQLDETLGRVAEHYWTGEIWLAQGGGKVGPADAALYNRAWAEARKLSARLRLLDRHRNRGFWFQAVRPPWEPPRTRPSDKQPPIVVFYSFKGGVGRTTSLASFAIQRARAGERVVVLDADLDAPGVGHLLTGADGLMARWGILDYLLERPRGEVDLRDYYHACRRQEVTGSGEILVFPAGRVDSQYLGKLARVDLEPNPDGEQTHPLRQLLEDVRAELRPQWILLDARAGLADPAGMLLGGLAHLHVLFGSFSEQSWAGLRLVLERLGAERIQTGKPQADCLVVQAMVPEDATLGKQARRLFEDRARDEMVDVYYAEDPARGETEDDYWYVGDAESSDAPHVPIPISYASKLATYQAIDDVADHLAEALEYRQLAGRILARFGGDA